MILHEERAGVPEMNSSFFGLGVRFLFVNASKEKFVGVIPRRDNSVLL